MCYYNGCRVSRAEYIRLIGIERELKALKLLRPAQSGFDYKDWPIIKPSADNSGYDLLLSHWEYIPATIADEFALRDARIMFTWLNARGENLLKNEKGRQSMFRDGARNGRCLVLSSGFYEYRHVPKIGKRGQPLKQTEKIPYYITLKDKPLYFFMAGVSRNWTNESRGQSASTFAIVTTQANELMRKVHNRKERMPVILPEDIAIKWLRKDLSDDDIIKIGTYQYNAEDMIAWPVAKDFVKKENPEEEFAYENLIPL